MKREIIWERVKSNVFVAGWNVFRFIERSMTKVQAGTVPDGANVMRTSANNPCLPVGLGDMFSG